MTLVLTHVCGHTWLHSAFPSCISVIIVSSLRKWNDLWSKLQPLETQLNWFLWQWHVERLSINLSPNTIMLWANTEPDHAIRCSTRGLSHSVCLHSLLWFNLTGNTLDTNWQVSQTHSSKVCFSRWLVHFTNITSIKEVVFCDDCLCASVFLKDEGCALKLYLRWILNQLRMSIQCVIINYCINLFGITTVLTMLGNLHLFKSKWTIHWYEFHGGLGLGFIL